jgi:N-hydroxyarylamine O-acetyltransferase
MTFAPDLDAYFTRIGYRGPRAPTLQTLSAIVLAHIQAIPFENLDVLLGRGIDLDPAAVERKLVHERRGGYCFEQNSHLLYVLGALGFAVTPLSGRVRVNRPRDYMPARTHCFVRVDLDGAPWLADVGVGALSPTAPLRFDTENEQATPHEPRRIVREGAWDGLALRGPDARMLHQVRFGDAWHDVCELTMEPMPPIDREVGNWYTSAHPRSHFRDRLIVARAAPDGGRVTLLNGELKVRDRAGIAEVRPIASAEALLAVLSEEFSLEFPAGTRFGAAGAPWPT